MNFLSRADSKSCEEHLAAKISDYLQKWKTVHRKERCLFPHEYLYRKEILEEVLKNTEIKKTIYREMEDDDPRAHKPQRGLYILTKNQSEVLFIVENSTFTAQGPNKKAVLGIITEVDSIVNKIVPKPQKNETKLISWYFTGRDIFHYSKTIDVPKFNEIKENYLPETQKSIEWLISHKNPYELGKLIFWMGKPGTGKTFCLRSLLREWKFKCNIHLICDPEMFFRNGSYLHEVLSYEEPVTPAQYERNKEKFNLIIIEDSPRVVLQESRVGNGTYDMSRFLNITDGILGQGLKTLFLLTTNDEIDDIDPAFLRNGRCIQRLEFDLFSEDEANLWLEKHNCKKRVDNPVPLSTLYALLRGAEADTPQLEPEKFGFATSLKKD